MTRGIDIRFVLIAIGLLLASIAMAPWAVFDAFQAAVGNGGIIGPICSAMGYAYVLKATGSDRDMVLLLTRPLRSMRWALVPGGVAIGFITNMAITSQTASAAALGPVLIPIMRSAGYSPLAAAVTLLVGCSVGGNLFNPGEPDIVTIKDVTSVLSADVINVAVVPNLLAVAAATLVLMLTLRPTEIPTDVPTDEEAVDAAPTSYAKALLPPLPVIALLLLQPGLNLVPPLFTIYPNGVHVSMVMLLSTAIAMTVHMLHEGGGRAFGLRAWRTHVTHLTTEFFDGMGYAFAHVISIIIAASCFIAGLTALGVIDAASTLLASNLELARVASPVLTSAMAVVSGSGTAPSVAFSKAMLPGILPVSAAQAIDVGVLGAIGANVGRTMSPVAAVVLFTSALASVSIADLVRLSARAMLAALAAVILYGLLL
ncbi:MAG: C4-dicarboxylate transporter DcuC [Candidatus Kapaibacteriota bacterium]